MSARSVILAALLVCLQESLAGWSQWSQWSPCSRTCGQGLSYSRRHCQQFPCDGQIIKYKLCIEKDCKGRKPIRDAECAKYNQQLYQGQYYRWTSTQSSGDPCALVCRAHRGGHVIKIGTMRLDGSKCSNSSYCIGGLCKPVGCDKIFESNLRLDRCGVCGGANSTCDVRLQVNMGNYNWKMLWKPCSVTCGTGYEEAQLTCVKTTSGELVPSMHCVQSQGWVVTRRQCSRSTCPASWRLGAYGPCSAACGGGVQHRRVECVQANGAKSRVADSSLCPQPFPKINQPCNVHPCGATWDTNLWSACSVTCGQGTQARKVVCTVTNTRGLKMPVDDSKCLQSKPDATRKCYRTGCKPDALYVPLILQENSTFLQLKPMKSVVLNVGTNAMLLPRGKVIIRCPVKNFHRKLLFWKKDRRLVPLQGRMRVSLKGALRIRRTKQQDHGIYTCIAGSLLANSTISFQSQTRAMESANSFARNPDTTYASAYTSVISKKPADSLSPSDAGKSRRKPEFRVGKWEKCSVTCGFGQQFRKVSCSVVTSQFIKTLPDQECVRRGYRKPPNVQKCSKLKQCPVWRGGQWNQCSDSHCFRDGYAMQKRKIFCVNPDNSLAKSRFCDGKPKPEYRRVCVNSSCQSVWHTTRWTQCKPSCGISRYRLRLISCVWKTNTIPAGINCRGKPRPLIRFPCKSLQCSGVCTDESRFCNLMRYLKMCRYPQFRRKCCASCANSVWNY